MFICLLNKDNNNNICILGCGANVRQSVLHISPPVITPSAPSHPLHRGRDSIPHLDDVQHLSDLVKRSTGKIRKISCNNFCF